VTDIVSTVTAAEPVTLIDALAGLFASGDASAKAITALLHDYGWARPGEKEDDRIVHDYGWWRPERIVGLAELAKLTGVTKQAIGRRMHREDAPEPVHLKMGPIWYLPDALKVAKEEGRRGRKAEVRQSGILAAAEILAASLGDPE
jgi:hypothetical protein